MKNQDLETKNEFDILAHLELDKDFEGLKIALDIAFGSKFRRGDEIGFRLRRKHFKILRDE